MNMIILQTVTKDIKSKIKCYPLFYTFIFKCRMFHFYQAVYIFFQHYDDLLCSKHNCLWFFVVFNLWFIEVGIELGVHRTTY